MTIANHPPTFRLIPFVAISLAGLVGVFSPGAGVQAQQPDPEGWSKGDAAASWASDDDTGQSETPLSANQPVSLSDEPGFDIRSQIGLAGPNDQDVASQPDEIFTAKITVDEDDNESSLADLFTTQNKTLTSRDGLTSSIKVALLLATLSLAPAIVLMTTCYVRIIVVLTLLRQAFGAQQLPPTQVLTALSLFVTLLVMTPVWTQVKTQAIDPYTQEDGISWEEAWNRGVVPVKAFMARQIKMADNGDSIALFYKYLPNPSLARPTNPEDVPLNVLLPAFMVSELKIAFLLGFQIYLPFLVLDLVVSSVTVSTGMLMLPPTMVSLPLKLILFVLVDGWNLVVGMLLQSFGAVP